VIDEPELHLHPKWQAQLLKLFEELAKDTGNQFLMSTHSPSFVSPVSIQYVSRVYSDNQRSRLVRLNSRHLPERKHLLSIVNSQNNERIFFTDKVILVEGISDRLFFEKVFEKLGIGSGSSRAFEIVDVGGKMFFEPYVSILTAAQVDHAIIADLDYVREVGSDTLRSIFTLSPKDLKNAIKNVGSTDGAALVDALERAIESGSIEKLKPLWEYMKLRRRKLRADLSGEETSSLSEFIQSKKSDHVFILSKGGLEAYLPEGFAGKDVDKLIRFLNEDDFYDCLPPERRSEIEVIAKEIGRI
jgi:predicted ATP-dependent endonuclease of OLD family